MKIRSIASGFSHARDDYIFEPSENPLSTFSLFPFFYLLRKVLNRDSIQRSSALITCQSFGLNKKKQVV